MVRSVTGLLEHPPRRPAPSAPDPTAPTIAIDAGPLLGHGGISGYVGPLVRALLALDPASRYRLVLRRGWLGHPEAGTLDRLAPVVRIGIPDRVLAFWWDRLGRPLPVARDLWGSVDVFLATCLVAPRLPRGKVVAIVYDLIPLRLPALFPQRERFREELERVVRRSTTLIAISRRTRDDLIELLGVNPDRVRVIYPGRGDAFRPVPASEAAVVAGRYGIRGRYVLYLGALGPHKNVATLLAAYQRARLKGSLEARLVVAGSPHWGAEVLAVLETLRVRNEVTLTGPVPAVDLPALYAGAECFVFPSRYEGFGLPVLEAMACGTPVITSNCGALPEVGGGASLLVDPEDPEALAAALCRVAGDPELRARLAAAGLAQAARFSWAQSAAELLDLFRAAAGVGPHHG